MTHTYEIGGQVVAYNAERKIANTYIEEAFLKAGKIFGFKGAGIGINYELIKFVVQRKAILMAYVAFPSRRHFWISWDKLKQNSEKKYDYKAGGVKWVKVIPLNEFNGKMEMIQN